MSVTEGNRAIWSVLSFPTAHLNAEKYHMISKCTYIEETGASCHKGFITVSDYTIWSQKNN